MRSRSMAGNHGSQSISIGRESASYHDGIAPVYDACMDEAPGNAWVRGAFRALVEEELPAGSRVLDFGCGTGSDALWLGRRRCRVLAYDNAPMMVTALASRLSDNAPSPRVEAWTAPYEHFAEDLAARAAGGLDGAIADFAVLNMIADLEPLFGTFGDALRHGGVVVASVLNPFFWTDLAHPAWWAPCVRGLRSGAVMFPGVAAPCCRHLVSGIVAAAARSGLRLEARASAGSLIRYSRGPRDWSCPRTLAERVERRLWRRWPLASAGKFLFLVFRLDGAQTVGLPARRGIGSASRAQAASEWKPAAGTEGRQ